MNRKEPIAPWGVLNLETGETQPRKTVVLKQVVDLYPRMLGLLKAVELRDYHSCYLLGLKVGSKGPCLKCQIQALLKEVEK
jgi:hypothetical protein